MPVNSTPAASSMALSLHYDLMASMVVRRPDAIGDVAIELWEGLSKSLTVIIGIEGFEALYDRSLHLVAATFAWLDHDAAPSTNLSRFACLKSGLEGRDFDESVKASALLLSTFTGVLSTLIGQQLTNNILRSAWGDAFEEAALEISQWPKK